MTDIQLTLTQRYYHFIALRGTKTVIRADFFTDWKITEKARSKMSSNCTVYLYSMASSFQYYRSDLINNRDAKGPFPFDVLLIEHKNTGLILIGFPFRKMTVDLISSLENKYKVLSKSTFTRIDMMKLIKANHRKTDLYFEDNHFWLAGVFISLTGDSFLSTVKLSGDKPLDSDIYKNYFREKLSREDKKSGLEKCILKSKISGENDSKSYSITSSVHIDKYGNYKIYLQNNGKNLLSMISTFDFLQSLDCLADTPRNPVFHISKEDNEI